MGNRRTLWGIVALVGVLGCSGPAVQYDYDAKTNFSAYRTYDWRAAPGAAPGKAAGFDNSIMNGRVRRAVETELAAKGFRKETAADPDFLVIYHPVGRATRARRAHVGMGFGFGPLGLGVAAPVGEPQVQTEGSIVLEVEDFRTGTQVWRATAEGVLQGSDSPEEADSNVAEAVHSLLKRFPPPVK